MFIINLNPCYVLRLLIVNLLCKCCEMCIKFHNPNS
jgi:hypothetical protein